MQKREPHAYEFSHHGKFGDNGTVAGASEGKRATFRTEDRTDSCSSVELLEPCGRCKRSFGRADEAEPRPNCSTPVLKELA